MKTAYIRKKVLRVVQGLSYVLIMGTPVLAFAQESFIVPIPGANDPNDIAGYVKALFTYAVGLGALLAMVMIVIGALQYTLSEAVTNKEDARDRIKQAIWGLILLLASVLILRTINPDIVKLENIFLKTATLSPSPTVNSPTANTNPPGENFCGNGVVDEGEKCDPGPTGGGGKVGCSTGQVCLSCKVCSGNDLE